MKNISAKDLYEQYQILDENFLDFPCEEESKAMTIARALFLEEIKSHCDEELETCDSMTSEESVYHADKVLEIKEKIFEELSRLLFKISQRQELSPVEFWDDEGKKYYDKNNLKE